MGNTKGEGRDKSYSFSFPQFLSKLFPKFSTASLKVTKENTANNKGEMGYPDINNTNKS